MQWFSCKYPKYDKLFFHIPNGGSRHFLEAVSLKKQGVKSGVPDNFLAVPRGKFHGLFLELKSSSGKLSKNQAEMIQFLNEQGYSACVSNSFEGACAIIKTYLDIKE